MEQGCPCHYQNMGNKYGNNYLIKIHGFMFFSLCIERDGMGYTIYICVGMVWDSLVLVLVHMGSRCLYWVHIWFEMGLVFL